MPPTSSCESFKFEVPTCIIMCSNLERRNCLCSLTNWNSFILFMQRCSICYRSNFRWSPQSGLARGRFAREEKCFEYWFIDRMVCNHMEPFRLFSISIRVELICQAVIIVDTFWLVIKRWVKETASDYTTRSVHWCFFFNSKQHWNVFNSLLKHHWFTCLFLLQSTSQQVSFSLPLSIKCFPQLSQQLKTTRQFDN